MATATDCFVIPKRDGVMLAVDLRYDELVIKVHFNFVRVNPGEIIEVPERHVDRSPTRQNAKPSERWRDIVLHDGDFTKASSQ